MSVADDFIRFNNAYNIDRDTIASISYRYRRITRQLNSDFWNTASDTAHSLYAGSYGRDTAARGLSDLDIGFVLPMDSLLFYRLSKLRSEKPTKPRIVLETVKLLS
jgi:tRNA nucleotidyltransferase (CCA-adding enzyme)